MELSAVGVFLSKGRFSCVAQCWAPCRTYTVAIGWPLTGALERERGAQVRGRNDWLLTAVRGPVRLVKVSLAGVQGHYDGGLKSSSE